MGRTIETEDNVIEIDKSKKESKKIGSELSKLSNLLELQQMIDDKLELCDCPIERNKIVMREINSKLIETIAHLKVLKNLVKLK